MICQLLITAQHSGDSGWKSCEMPNDRFSSTLRRRRLGWLSAFLIVSRRRTAFSECKEQWGLLHRLYWNKERVIDGVASTKKY